MNQTTKTKSTHGGKRKNAGRPKLPYNRELIRVNFASDEEKHFVLGVLTDPRDRAKILYQEAKLRAGL